MIIIHRKIKKQKGVNLTEHTQDLTFKATKYYYKIHGLGDSIQTIYNYYLLFNTNFLLSFKLTCNFK